MRTIRLIYQLFFLILFVFLGLAIISANAWYGKKAVEHYSKDKVEKSIRM